MAKSRRTDSAYAASRSRSGSDSGAGVEIVGLAAREGAQLIAVGLIGDEKWHSEPRDESCVIWNGERPAGGVKPQRHNESMANRSNPPAHRPVSTPDSDNVYRRNPSHDSTRHARRIRDSILGSHESSLTSVAPLVSTRTESAP